MKIIISPAKKMRSNLESLEYQELPHMIEYTKTLQNKMKELSVEEAKALWKCNDKLAAQNYERFQKMNLDSNLTPAILAYEGIQYQYMSPTVFEEEMLTYLQKHLRILSGFYGVVKPMDGVVPYRLEMQAKLHIEQAKNLYEYWGKNLYEVIKKDAGGQPLVIINLASKEYSDCIEKYLSPEDRFITCIFGELVGDKVVQKGTYAKMARGEMVRFMAENNIEEIEGITKFNRLNYCYNEKLSTQNKLIFLLQ